MVDDITALDVYSKEVARYKPMTEEMEQAWFTEYKDSNSRDVRDAIVKANLRLVIKLAQDYTDYGLDIEDLIQEGNIGLLEAVDKFDPSLGFRFSTYAAWWIKQKIRRALTNHSRDIRIPANKVELLSRLSYMKKEFMKVGLGPPSDQDIADELNISMEDVKRLKDLSEPLALDEVVFVADDGSEITRGDIVDEHGYIYHQEARTVEDDTALEILNGQLSMELRLALSPIEYIVLLTRLLTEKEDEPERRKRKRHYSLQNVADLVGYSQELEKRDLSRERIRQIETQALEKLNNNPHLKEMWLGEDHNNVDTQSLR